MSWDFQNEQIFICVFRRTHRLGYKNMLHIHIPEKFVVFFLQNTPLALVLGHVRYSLSNTFNSFLGGLI